MNKGSIEIPFPVGAKVWWAGSKSETRDETCPDCAGKCTATVVLGCGDAIEVPCPTCSRGCNPPTGTVAVVTCGAHPREVVLDGVEMHGGEIEYRIPAPGGGYYILHPEDLFDDLAACEARCAVKAAQWQREEDDRVLACRRQKRRDVVNPVRYWRGEVRKLERELEAARRKAGM